METPETRAFAAWCRATCPPGKGCKARRKVRMTWKELMELCKKRLIRG
jgi:hypothetical protein